MSKSLGNFITLRDALHQHKGEVIRMALLSSHYRQTLDFTDRLLEQSKVCLDHLYRCLDDKPPQDDDHAAVVNALSDDLNTPSALTVLQTLGKEINKTEDGRHRQALQGQLYACGRLLGFFQESPSSWFQGGARLQEDEIQRAITARHAARLAKDYALSDQIRNDLWNQGIVLEDHKDGRTTWSLKS